jgi:pimeloyl-ACP methyl ester carboxylesterase
MEDSMVSVPDGMAPSVDPTGPGPYTTSSTEDSLRRSRRTVPMVVHRPSGVMAPPIVILLPGFMLEARYYRSLAERIASHGFLVVQADPPSSLMSANHIEMRDDVIAVIDWVQMMGLSDPGARIAVAGHSLGGKVAAMVTAEDVRVQALLGIDPVNGGNPFTGYSATLPDIVPEPVNTISVPAGFLGETVNAMGGSFGMACAPRDQNFQTFFQAATAAPWVAEWEFVGADHMDFLSDSEGCGFVCTQCPSGSADPAQVVSSTMTLAVAFFRHHLVGDDQSAYLTGDLVPPGVMARSR